MSKTITRTISTASINYIVANTETMKMSKEHATIPCTTKLTIKEITKALSSYLSANESLLNFEVEGYTSALRSITIEDFYYHSEYVKSVDCVIEE